MEKINVLLLKLQIYWQIPGFRIALGVALLALGLIIVVLPEGRKALGLLLTIIGLGTLLHGVSEVAGYSIRRSRQPSQATQQSASASQKSRSFMHIQIDPQPHGK